VRQVEKSRTENSEPLSFNDIFVALGGEPRNWHPAHSALERVENVDSRMNFSHHTDAIGRMGEEYLEETYNMEIIDDGEVDLRITDGVFEGLPVQSKCAIRVASRGERTSDGGIYMKGPAMGELAGATYNPETQDYEMTEQPKEGLLHTIIHQPREEYSEQVKDDLDLPLRDIIKKEDGKVAETFLVGELVIPAYKAVESVKFNTGDRRAKYWDWQKAYLPAKDGNSNAVKVSDWYSDSFIAERMYNEM
jgi:hypothetical protein